MFDLHLYQNINVSANCKDLKVNLLDSKEISLDDLFYKLNFTSEIDEKTFESRIGNLKNKNTFEERGISLSLPNNVLKESNFRFEFIKSEGMDYEGN